MPVFYQNLSGIITWTTAGGTPQGDILPDERTGSGLPEPGAVGNMQVGDLITFNTLSGDFTTLTGIGDTDLHEFDGSSASNRTLIDSDLFGQPAGTDINTGYGLVLSDGTNTYNMYAVSFGINNNDPGSRDYTDMFVFEGAAPAPGVQLNVVQIIGIAGVSYANITCFTPGTLIECDTGVRRIEDLEVGDRVSSTTNGTDSLVQIRWIGRRHVHQEDLLKNPKLYPVRILAGALGGGLPKRDLLVSRQHRMLVSSKIVQRMTGASEALVPAITLTQLPGVYVDKSVESVTYYHLLFDQHEVICAEGAETESLFLGPIAINALSHEARWEIFELFPDLKKIDGGVAPARKFVSGQKGKRLVERHIRNRRDVNEKVNAVSLALAS